MDILQKLKDIFYVKNIGAESPIEQSEDLCDTSFSLTGNNGAHVDSPNINCSIKFEHLSKHELNNNERNFFRSLIDQTLAAGISGIYTATRNSCGEYSIEFTGVNFGCWVGRIFLPEKTYNFAVIKYGNKKASRVFDDLTDAEYYVKTHPADTFQIERRAAGQEKRMQYLYGKAEESRNVSGEDISKYIKAIKYWIWYIKRCKKESDSFLR